MTRSVRSPLTARVAVIGALVALGLIVGFAGATWAQTGGFDESLAPSNGATTDWPENADGLTYGSAPLAACPEDEPDLIAARASNGEEGYVLKTDLEGPTPSSPEEALRLQAANAGKSRVILVYEVDGKTVIGEFVIGPGMATQLPPSSE